jgi:hypothetical protein
MSFVSAYLHVERCARNPHMMICLKNAYYKKNSSFQGSSMEDPPTLKLSHTNSKNLISENNMPFNSTRIFLQGCHVCINNDNLREKIKLKLTPSPQHLGMEHLAYCQLHQPMDPNGKFESKCFQIFIGT